MRALPKRKERFHFYPQKITKMSEKVKISEMASVSGIGGLHKILGRTRVGLLIESLNEAKKKQSVPLNNKVSVLSEIAMFAISEDRRLGLIFENIHQLVNSEGLQFYLYQY